MAGADDTGDWLETLALLPLSKGVVDSGWPWVSYGLNITNSSSFKNILLDRYLKMQ